MRLLLAPFLSLLALALPLAASAQFSDVPDTHPHAQAIQFIKEKGIVEGYADKTFKPNQPIIRAEFTKILVETQIDPDLVKDCLYADHQFPDVPSNVWYTQYICVARQQRILSGYPDGTFQPANTINFVEAAKIIANTMGYAVSAGDPWFQPFVEKLAEINAIPPSVASFNHKLTRGEMAEMIFRIKSGTFDKPSKTFDQLAGQSATYDDTLKRDVLQAINAERKTANLPPLQPSPILDTVAQSYAQQMKTEDFFDHTDPQGRTITDRLDAAGYAYTYYGENIGIGAASAREIYENWQASPPHRQIYLSPDMQQTGLGYVRVPASKPLYAQGYYWVMVYASPKQ